MMVSDMINVNVSGSIVSAAGGAIIHEAHLVTRGPDAGLYSTISKSERVGLLLDLSAGFSFSTYNWTVDQIRFSDYLGDSADIGGKIFWGVSGSMSYGPKGPTWGTVGASWGLSAGGYVGHSTTDHLFK